MQHHAHTAQVFRSLANLLEGAKLDTVPFFGSQSHYPLTVHQWEIVSAVNDFRVFVSSGRRQGLSIAAAAAASLYALSRPKETVYLCTFNRESGEKFRKIIEEELMGLVTRIPGGSEAVALYRLDNGSHIAIRTHSAIFRGVAPDLIVVDQAERLQEDTFVMMQAERAKLMLLTTDIARLPHYLEQEQKSPRWTRISIAGPYQAPAGGEDLHVTRHIKGQRCLDGLEWSVLCKGCKKMSPGVDYRKNSAAILRSFGWHLLRGDGRWICPACWSKLSKLKRFMVKLGGGVR